MRKPRKSTKASSISEAVLVEKLVRKLHREGFKVRIEVSNMGQSADIVATKGRWVTVVEAKLFNWRRALQQCRAHEHVADYICVAVASVGIPSPLLETATTIGYGVLHFNRATQQFTWRLKPTRNSRVWKPQRRHWVKNMRRIAYAS